MPTLVRFRVKVKRSSSVVQERNPISKKQRTTQPPAPSIYIKGELVNAHGHGEEVTVRTGEIDKGSTACNHGPMESALCKSPYDPYLYHSTSTSTSSTTSNHCRSEVSLCNSDDNAEKICAFEGTLKSNLDSLSNQESESQDSNNGSSELRSDEDLEYEEVARRNLSTAHEQAVMPYSISVNNEKETRYPSWDERSQEVVDFKKLHGHANVPANSDGPCIPTQLTQYHLYPSPTITLWGEHFQQLVDFKKIHGHANVPYRAGGPLGLWVNNQRKKYKSFTLTKNADVKNWKALDLHLFLCHIGMNDFKN